MPDVEDFSGYPEEAIADSVRPVILRRLPGQSGGRASHIPWPITD
jgi:hypothetical protein